MTSDRDAALSEELRRLLGVEPTPGTPHEELTLQVHAARLASERATALANSKSRHPATVEVNESGEHQTSAPRLSRLPTVTLRRLYTEIVGRETKSQDRRYLIGRIQAARAGRIPTGPAPQRPSAAPLKPLGLRLPGPAIAALDEARLRHGHRSRAAFVRKAVHDLLLALGEPEAAELFVER